MTTKFKKSFSPMLICWNDIKIHLGFEDSYLVPPPYFKSVGFLINYFLPDNFQAQSTSYRFACSTCPYVYNITKRISNRSLQ